MDQKAHHDFKTKELIKNLEAEGKTVGNPIYFRGCDASKSCIPDIPVRDNNGNFYLIEVKTGNAGLSRNQEDIFPEIRNGNAIPTNTAAEAFGLIPGVKLKDQGYPNGIDIQIIKYEGIK